MTINSTTFFGFDPSRVPSPCFVVDEHVVERNLKILDRVQQETGAKILLALKAFSMFSLSPLVCQYLTGVCASGLHEARLGYEEFSGNKTDIDKREVHVFSTAYKYDELEELLSISDHVVFNSFDQWNRFKVILQTAKMNRPELEFGLRINPMHSEGVVPMYDPCAPGSRLGIPIEAFRQYAPNPDDLNGIDGLHFHSLCEQGFEPLARTLDVIEAQFADYLHKMNWVNFGGGHHITHSDYDIDALIDRINGFKAKYGVQVYLEPGEAIAINTGVLVSEVLDLGHNQMDIAVLDTSATCHMPDTIEMPYRPEILMRKEGDSRVKAGKVGEKPFAYRLGGQTCLAGDVMGDYSFDEPLHVGQRLMFDDMSHYTMVKTSTFNGISLPALAIWNSETDNLRIVKTFDYQDFRDRLS